MVWTSMKILFLSLLTDTVENIEVYGYLVWGLTKFRIIAILLRSKEPIFYFLSIPSSVHSLKKKIAPGLPITVKLKNRGRGVEREGREARGWTRAGKGGTIFKKLIPCVWKSFLLKSPRVTWLCQPQCRSLLPPQLPTVKMVRRGSNIKVNSHCWKQGRLSLSLCSLLRLNNSNMNEIMTVRVSAVWLLLAWNWYKYYQDRLARDDGVMMSTPENNSAECHRHCPHTLSELEIA